MNMIRGNQMDPTVHRPYAESDDSESAADRAYRVVKLAVIARRLRAADIDLDGRNGACDSHAEAAPGESTSRTSVAEQTKVISSAISNVISNVISVADLDDDEPAVEVAPGPNEHRPSRRHAAGERRWAAVDAGGRSSAGGDPSPDDDATDDDPVRPRKRRSRVPRILLAIAVVIAVVFVSTRVVHDRRISSARASGLAAATQDALLIGTYNYAQLDQDIAAVSAHLTPAFAQQFNQHNAANTATRNRIVQAQAVSSASVQGAVVSAASPQHVVVLVFLDQSVTVPGAAAPDVQSSRLTMTLVRTGNGPWLVLGLVRS
jgi:Mce-associated membrane protein